MSLGRSSTLNAGEVSIAALAHLAAMLGRGRWELVNESRRNSPYCGLGAQTQFAGERPVEMARPITAYYDPIN